MTSVDALLESMTIHISEAMKSQIEGEKALNKSSKDLFGRLLGPERGTGGLLFGKINGQV